MVEKIEISAELVERVTRTFLKKMTGHLRGTKVAIMNATIQEGYNQFVGFPQKS